jgi:hypothetical protein
MARTQRNHTRNTQPRTQPQPPKATVVHDGSAFRLAVDLRHYGFDVDEGPLFSSASVPAGATQLAVIATRPGAARRQRLRQWARDLCGNGATLLAIGSAVGPVAELFGTSREVLSDLAVSARLADVGSASQGLFSGVPAEFRLALPAGARIEASALSAEFGTTAWSKDGELVGASHVFRPVHLLHAGALESGELRSMVLRNLVRLLRDSGGRAF